MSQLLLRCRTCWALSLILTNIPIARQSEYEVCWVTIEVTAIEVPNENGPLRGSIGFR